MQDYKEFEHKNGSGMYSVVSETGTIRWGFGVRHFLVTVSDFDMSNLIGKPVHVSVADLSGHNESVAASIFFTAPHALPPRGFFSPYCFAVRGTSRCRMCNLLQRFVWEAAGSEGFRIPRILGLLERAPIPEVQSQLPSQNTLSLHCLHFHVLPRVTMLVVSVSDVKATVGLPGLSSAMSR